MLTPTVNIRSGQVLHSNGTASYWAADDNAGGTYDLNVIVQLNANDYIDIIVDPFDPMRLYMGSIHTVFHMFFLG